MILSIWERNTRKFHHENLREHTQPELRCIACSPMGQTVKSSSINLGHMKKLGDFSQPSESHFLNNPPPGMGE